MHIHRIVVLALIAALAAVAAPGVATPEPFGRLELATHERGHEGRKDPDEDEDHDHDHDDEAHDHDHDDGDEIHVDSTYAVARDARLDLVTFRGRIEVVTWDRDAVRLVAMHGPRARVEVDRAGATLRVRSSGVMAGLDEVDYTLTVPAWLPLSLSGINSDIHVHGSQAEIRAETVSGDVSIIGGRGYLELGSVEGDISVEGASGRLSVTVINGDARITRGEGEISVEGVNGDVHLVEVSTLQLEAATVNGDLRFEGPVRSSGRYRLSTHSGEVAFVPVGALDAVVQVATFSGSFESSFAVTLRETRRGKRFSFTVGSGAANVELESFQGTIRLGAD